MARKGVAKLILSCPRATTTGCSGTETLLDQRGRRIATGTPHRIAAGTSASVSFTLPAAVRSRAGARLVSARIVDKGAFGPKTSGAVLPPAVTT